MPLILRISTSGLQLAMIRLMNSPFLHYQQVSGSEIINIGKAGNHLPPWPQGQGGGGLQWLPVFPVLIFISWKPADYAKVINQEIQMYVLMTC